MYLHCVSFVTKYCRPHLGGCAAIVAEDPSRTSGLQNALLGA